MKIRIVRIIAYAFFIAFTMVLFGYFRAFFFLMLFVIEVVLAAADIASVIFLRDRLEFTLRAPVLSAEKNDPVPLVFTVENSTIVPSFELSARLITSNSFYGAHGETVINLPVRARGESVRRFPLNFSLLGTYDFTVEIITIRDLLGFVDLKKNVDQDVSVTVFPGKDKALKYDPDESVAGMTEADETDHKGNDFADVSEIREYVPGDRPRDIHWKLSAKKDELMVKQRLAMSDEQLVVTIEFADVAADNDQVMEETYALGRELVRGSVNTVLMWWNADEEEFHQKRISAIEDVDAAFIEIYSGRAQVAPQDMRLLMGSVHPEIKAFLLVHFTGDEVEETVVNEA